MTDFRVPYVSELDRLRADQHNELRLPSDHALAAYLAEANPDVVRLDLLPHSPIEVRHLAHALPSDWEVA